MEKKQVRDKKGKYTTLGVDTHNQSMSDWEQDLGPLHKAMRSDPYVKDTTAKEPMSSSDSRDKFYIADGADKKSIIFYPWFSDFQAKIIEKRTSERIYIASYEKNKGFKSFGSVWNEFFKAYNENAIKGLEDASALGDLSSLKKINLNAKNSLTKEDVATIVEISQGSRDRDNKNVTVQNKNVTIPEKEIPVYKDLLFLLCGPIVIFHFWWAVYPQATRPRVRELIRKLREEGMSKEDIGLEVQKEILFSMTAYVTMIYEEGFQGKTYDNRLNTSSINTRKAGNSSTYNKGISYIFQSVDPKILKEAENTRGALGTITAWAGGIKGGSAFVGKLSDIDRKVKNALVELDRYLANLESDKRQKNSGYLDASGNALTVPRTTEDKKEDIMQLLKLKQYADTLGFHNKKSLGVSRGEKNGSNGGDLSLDYQMGNEDTVSLGDTIEGQYNATDNLYKKEGQKKLIKLINLVRKELDSNETPPYQLAVAMTDFAKLNLTTNHDIADTLFARFKQAFESVQDESASHKDALTRIHKKDYEDEVSFGGGYAENENTDSETDPYKYKDYKPGYSRKTPERAIDYLDKLGGNLDITDENIDKLLKNMFVPNSKLSTEYKVKILNNYFKNPNLFEPKTFPKTLSTAKKQFVKSIQNIGKSHFDIDIKVEGSESTLSVDFYQIKHELSEKKRRYRPSIYERTSIYERDFMPGEDAPISLEFFVPQENLGELPTSNNVKNIRVRVYPEKKDMSIERFLKIASDKDNTESPRYRLILRDMKNLQIKKKFPGSLLDFIFVYFGSNGGRADITDGRTRFSSNGPQANEEKLPPTFDENEIDETEKSPNFQTIRNYLLGIPLRNHDIYDDAKEEPLTTSMKSQMIQPSVRKAPPVSSSKWK